MFFFHTNMYNVYLGYNNGIIFLHFKIIITYTLIEKTKEINF